MSKIRDYEAMRRQLVLWRAERDKLRSRLAELSEHIRTVEEWLAEPDK